MGRILLILLLTAFSVSAWSAQYKARHGMTGAQYQQQFNTLSNQGFRLVSISGYTKNGTRFASIWHKTSGPKWAARHNLSSQQYQAAVNEFKGKGYQPTYVSIYAVKGKARYAAIFEKKSGAWAARHGLTPAQYQSAVNEMKGKGFALNHVSVANISGTPRFVALFDKKPQRPARHGLTYSQYQTAFNNFTRQGYRLKVVAGYKQSGKDRYAAIWEKTSGRISAFHGVRSKNYQAKFDNLHYSAWSPRYVQAFNSASGVKFNGIWDSPRYSRRDLNRIRNKVKAYMDEYDIPALTLAVALNGKLKFAQAYGRIDKENNQAAGPRHRFRVASVSKPITVAAIDTLNNVDYSDKVFGRNSILGGTFSTPSNNTAINNITVDHLVRHRAGFVRQDKDDVCSDPMFRYTGTSKNDLIDWALELYPLGYTPGSSLTSDPCGGTDLGAAMYSNFGYSILGRVIEEASGKSYEAYVRQAVLIPAGAKGMVIGGDKEADRKANEAKYYGSSAYSSVKPQRFDSHGGWIATPIDLLRFINHPGVLSGSSNYAHYGEMSGTEAILRRRSDGFTLSAATNTNDGEVTELNDLMVEIADEVSSWPNIDLF